MSRHYLYHLFYDMPMPMVQTLPPPICFNHAMVQTLYLYPQGLVTALCSTLKLDVRSGPLHQTGASDLRLNLKLVSFNINLCGYLFRQTSNDIIGHVTIFLYQEIISRKLLKIKLLHIFTFQLVYIQITCLVGRPTSVKHIHYTTFIMSHEYE